MRLDLNRALTAYPAPGVDERLQALFELVVVLSAEINLVVLPVETEADGLSTLGTVDVIGDSDNCRFCHILMVGLQPTICQSDSL